MLFSFDVFDTLITKRVSSTRGIFALMEERLKADKNFQFIPQYVRESFYELRLLAAQFARERAKERGEEEITLDEIYNVFSFLGEITLEEVKLLKNLEIEIELENVVGISRNIALVREYIEGGKRVVLISDTYLSEQLVKSLLLKVDDIFSDITVYTSSTYKKTKESGSLYELVREKEGAITSSWSHWGDHPQIDGKVPKSMGIKALFPPAFAPRLNHELRLLREGRKDVNLQILLGTTRRIRLDFGWNEGPARDGSSVVGPIVFIYAKWLLEESIKRGIKRLYFLSEDGFILKRVVDILIEEWTMPISTYYLYLSRDIFVESEEVSEEDNRYAFLPEYLRQEIDAQDNDFSFVLFQDDKDFLRGCTFFLNDVGFEKIKVFTFNLESLEYLPNVSIISLLPKSLNNISNLSILSQSPEGNLIGYDLEGEYIVPVIEEGTELMEEGYGDFVAGIECFSVMYSSLARQYNLKVSYLEKYLDEF